MEEEKCYLYFSETAFQIILAMMIFKMQNLKSSFQKEAERDTWYLLVIVFWLRSKAHTSLSSFGSSLQQHLQGLLHKIFSPAHSAAHGFRNSFPITEHTVSRALCWHWQHSHLSWHVGVYNKAQTHCEKFYSGGLNSSYRILYFRQIILMIFW